jgi:predicted Zn-dependent protease
MLLALSNAKSPSVIQVRAQDILKAGTNYAFGLKEIG